MVDLVKETMFPFVFSQVVPGRKAEFELFLSISPHDENAQAAMVNSNSNFFMVRVNNV